MRPLRVFYLAAIENPGGSPILVNQVVRLVEAMAGAGADVEITLIVLAPMSVLRNPSMPARSRALARRVRAAGARWVCRYLPLTSDQFYLRRRWMPFLLGPSRRWLGDLIAERPPDVIHARSYPSTLVALDARHRFAPQIGVCFDTRGMYPEEGVIAGRWSEGSADHLWWKRFEAGAFTTSDVVVNVSAPHSRHVLTIAPDARVETVPTVVDVQAFAAAAGEREATRRREELDGSSVIVFSGSFSRWRDERTIVSVYARVRKFLAPARLVVLSGSPKGSIARAAGALGVPLEEIVCRSLPPEAVPAWLAAADLGLMVEPDTPISDVTLASKTGEYLAAGLPVLVSAHSGGAVELVTAHGVGAAIETDAPGPGGDALLREALARFVPADEALRSRCRSVAARELDVGVAASRFRGLYRSLGRRESLR